MLELVAEIGLNHNGSEERAWNLLHSALDADVDSVTFQIREKSYYDGSSPMRRPLSDEFYTKAALFTKKHKKKIGFAIAQIEKVDFFLKIGANFWKTLSFDLTNMDLQEALQKTKKKVFISSGMSGIEDIKKVNEWLDNIGFIHTTLNYDLGVSNLKAIQTIREATNRDVAFGLHNPNHKLLYASLAMEPSALYFYIKDETGEESPDDEHALSTGILKSYVSDLRNLSLSVGNGDKVAHKNELVPEDNNKYSNA